MMELNQRNDKTMMEFKKTMMEFIDDDGIAYFTHNPKTMDIWNHAGI